MQGQLAQLREESERYKSKIEEVMQEGRMKDVKIMQLEIKILEAEMTSGERKPSNDLLTLVTDQKRPITALPSSLVQSGMKSDPCQPSWCIDLNSADCINYPPQYLANEDLRDFRRQLSVGGGSDTGPPLMHAPSSHPLVSHSGSAPLTRIICHRVRTLFRS